MNVGPAIQTLHRKGAKAQRTPRKGFLCVSFAPLRLCGVFFALGFLVPAHAAPSAADARQELLQLRSRIEAVQKQIAGAEESRNEAADALRESERAISDANRDLSELEQSSLTVTQRVETLRGESSKASGTLTEQQAMLSRLLYQQHVRHAGAQPEALRLLLSGDNPNAIAREWHYLGYVSRDIQRQRHEVGALQRNETRLTSLIEQLARIVTRAPPAKPKPAPAAARQRNDRIPEPQTLAGVFSQLRGQLALPVRGELAGRFGSPRNDGGLTWKGLLLAAKAGDAVKAVAAGRVVYADWLRGFGNLLIIDHGEGYMSLYGHNETLLKRVGDDINGGDAVATVGNSGGGTESGLYFELRHQGKPFDPMTWVKAR